MQGLQPVSVLQLNIFLSHASHMAICHLNVVNVTTPVT